MEETALRFRNPSGARYLKGLFYEESRDKASVVYTLKDHDHLGLPSLYRLYMECGDLTEYRFAMSHLDGWEHWEMLTSCSWFQPFVERWRRELELRVRSEALSNILVVAADKANPTSYHANKYLLDGQWKPSKRGRPSKDEIKSELNRQITAQKDVDEDAQRIGLN